MWPLMEEEKDLVYCVRHVMQKARGELWEKVGAVLAEHPGATWSLRYEEEILAWVKAGAEVWVNAFITSAEALPALQGAEQDRS